MGLWCCLLLLIKQNCVLKSFLKTFNLGDSGISLPAFSSRTAVKLDDIPVTPKLVKKAINSINFSKASDPDCILVAVMKNFEPEFSYILAGRFIIILRKSCFPDCWKGRSNLWFLYLKTLGRGLRLNITTL